MRKYELVLVLRASLKEADQKKLLDTVKDWLKGVKVVTENDWGQKPLAYDIKHESAGHYLQWMLESEEAVPAEVETRLLRQDGVLRHLLLRTK